MERDLCVSVYVCSTSFVSLCVRYELTSVTPDHLILQSMDKQAAAERTKRESITIAEGQKRSTELTAEGETLRIQREAEGRAFEMQKIAEAEKERLVQGASPSSTHASYRNHTHIAYRNHTRTGTPSKTRVLTFYGIVDLLPLR